MAKDRLEPTKAMIPSPALLSDLQAKGLLDQTLVVLDTEFGRSRIEENDGWDHHSKDFTCLLAGAGVRCG